MAIASKTVSMDGSLDAETRSRGPESTAAREANERVALSARKLKFVSRIPFFCECGDPDCRAAVMLRQHDYADHLRQGRPIITPEHGF